MKITHLLGLIPLMSVLVPAVAQAQSGTFGTPSSQPLVVSTTGPSFLNAPAPAPIVPGETGTTSPPGPAPVLSVQNGDRRFKANVRPLTGALGSLDLLRGVRYVFLPGKGPKGEQIGFIAQEVEKVYPELVRTDTRTGIKSVNYAQLTPVLLEAIKELKSELAGAREALLQEHDRTVATLEALSTRLQMLEAAAGSPRVEH